MSEGFRDRFDITPQQYHAGLDKLWTALGDDVDYSGQNIFDAIPQEISRLKQQLEWAQKQGKELHEANLQLVEAKEQEQKRDEFLHQERDELLKELQLVRDCLSDLLDSVAKVFDEEE